ncbi:MAG: hypothetical protein QOJ99_952 [Bryobacterales bacterium]|jgi:hypothetical protein|nr:hypothetical protein [Bryobacterales bacterium]
MAVNFHVISGWISIENQGGNIAAADLDKEDSPEPIVLRMDHSGNGPNRSE